MIYNLNYITLHYINVFCDTPWLQTSLCTSVNGSNMPDEILNSGLQLQTDTHMALSGT